MDDTISTEFKIGFFCAGATIAFALIYGHLGTAVWAGIAGLYMLRAAIAEDKA